MIGGVGITHKINKALISLSYKNFSSLNMKNTLWKKWKRGISGEVKNKCEKCLAFLVVCVISTMRTRWGVSIRPVSGCLWAQPAMQDENDTEKIGEFGRVQSKRNDTEKSSDIKWKISKGEQSKPSYKVQEALSTLSHLILK